MAFDVGGDERAAGHERAAGGPYVLQRALGQRAAHAPALERVVDLGVDEHPHFTVVVVVGVARQRAVHGHLVAGPLRDIVHADHDPDPTGASASSTLWPACRSATAASRNGRKPPG